jgi:hypothetical protein
MGTKHFYSNYRSVKGKSIRVQARTDPEGSRRLRLPDFKVMVRLSALRIGLL